MILANNTIRSSRNGRSFYMSCKDPYSIIGAPCNDWFLDMNNPMSGTVQFSNERLKKPKKLGEPGEAINLGMIQPDTYPKGDEVAHFTLMTSRENTYHLSGEEPIDLVVSTVITKFEEISETKKIFHVKYVVRAKYTIVNYTCKIGLRPWNAFPWGLIWSGGIEYCTEWTPFKFLDKDELVVVSAIVTCVRTAADYPLPNKYKWEVSEVEFANEEGMGGENKVLPKPKCVAEIHKDRGPF